MLRFLYTIGIGAVVGLSILIYKLLNRTYIVEDVRFNKIVSVFQKLNIESVKYLRSEIILKFTDIKLFDLDSFLELGIEEYTIEEDIIRFKFTGGKDYNYTLYLKIKERIKGGE